MKNSFLIAGIAALALIACDKKETVDTTNSADSMAVVATDSASMVADSAVEVIDSAAAVTVDAAADAAQPFRHAGNPVSGD